ncbi:hypothetical protein COB72_07575 [bacterium]|nr:MAG: hypothetical protein COB72_07575 [bacterium]
MDPQLQQRLMMYGGFIPGGISLVLLIAAWYIHAFKKSRVDHLDQVEDEEGEGQRRVSDGPRWMLPLMLLVGFAGADYAANYTFHLWPDGNNYRFTHAIALVALVGMLEGFVRLPMLVAFGFRALAFGGAFWMLAEGYPIVFGDSATFVGSAVFAALAGALVSTAADRNSEETPAWVDSISWIVIAGASMRILLQNHFSIGAMIPAGIIAVLVSTLITGLIFRDLRLSRGGVTVLVGLMLTMLTGSIIQTGVDNLVSVLLLALSPMVLVIPMKTLSGLRMLVARMILLVVILGSAGAMLYWAGSEGELGEEEGYPQDSAYESTP